MSKQMTAYLITAAIAAGMIWAYNNIDPINEALGERGWF